MAIAAPVATVKRRVALVEHRSGNQLVRQFGDDDEHIVRQPFAQALEEVLVEVGQ